MRIAMLRLPCAASHEMNRVELGFLKLGTSAGVQQAGRSACLQKLLGRWQLLAPALACSHGCCKLGHIPYAPQATC